MKVVVLAGGISTERDVSLISGKMIYQALKKKGHQVILVDVYLGLQGEVGDDIFDRDVDWAAQIQAISEQAPDIEKIKKQRADGNKRFFGPRVLDLCAAADAVFIGLHGVGGEDGKVQAVFDLMGIRYTGTDFTSAALAMDKGITKEIFRANGVPTPKGILIRQGINEDEKMPYPCIVKTCNGGSSIGVTIARNDEEYEAAKKEAFRYDNQAVVEEFIEGREFSVCVLEGKALPVIEIEPKQGFYDYKNKYQAGSTVETCPAHLSEEKTRQMQEMAEAAYRALRYHSYARMDFRMDREGRIFCLEANTLPGMTPTSLIPQEAAAIGIGFEDLCERILLSALKD
ncbi:MAG: D-alanine--D-alanine ligase [Lachnospiraceae bacterium]|nr:D-alanine--D-alanine ligase [Lachnospiraceae bacterium]